MSGHAQLRPHLDHALAVVKEKLEGGLSKWEYVEIGKCFLTCLFEYGFALAKDGFDDGCRDAAQAAWVSFYDECIAPDVNFPGPDTIWDRQIKALVRGGIDSLFVALQKLSD